MATGWAIAFQPGDQGAQAQPRGRSPWWRHLCLQAPSPHLLHVPLAEATYLSLLPFEGFPVPPNMPCFPLWARKDRLLACSSVFAPGLEKSAGWYWEARAGDLAWPIPHSVIFNCLFQGLSYSLLNTGHVHHRSVGSSLECSADKDSESKVTDQPRQHWPRTGGWLF